MGWHILAMVHSHGMKVIGATVLATVMEIGVLPMILLAILTAVVVIERLINIRLGLSFNPAEIMAEIAHLQEHDLTLSTRTTALDLKSDRANERIAALEARLHLHS